MHSIHKHTRFSSEFFLSSRDVFCVGIAALGGVLQAGPSFKVIIHWIKPLLLVIFSV